MVLRRVFVLVVTQKHFPRRPNYFYLHSPMIWIFPPTTPALLPFPSFASFAYPPYDENCCFSYGVDYFTACMDAKCPLPSYWVTGAPTPYGSMSVTFQVRREGKWGTGTRPEVNRGVREIGVIEGGGPFVGGSTQEWPLFMTNRFSATSNFLAILLRCSRSE
jgi:hypothetical protein